jgi:hypothetical protein
MIIQTNFFDYICFKCKELDFNSISPYIMISVIEPHLIAPYVDRIVQLKLIQLLERPEEHTLDNCFNVINSFERLNLFNVVNFKLACLRLCFQRLFDNQRYSDSIQAYLYISYLSRNNDPNDLLFQRYFYIINNLQNIPDGFGEMLYSHYVIESGEHKYINQNIEFMQNLLKLYQIIISRTDVDYNEEQLNFIKYFFENYMATGRIAKTIYLFVYTLFANNFNDQFYKIISRESFHLAKAYSSHFSCI